MSNIGVLIEVCVGMNRLFLAEGTNFILMYFNLIILLYRETHTDGMN